MLSSAVRTSSKRIRQLSNRSHFYSTSNPVPKANTDFLTPSHLDDNPPIEVLSRLAKYASVSLATYSRPPFILTRGHRCSVWDTQGREYLDFSGGIAVNALGHADEGVQKIIADQSQLLVHNSNLWHNEWAGELALLLVDSTKELGGMGYLPAASTPTPTADSETPAPVVSKDPTIVPSSGLKVFFSNSGTEANEGALKFARKWGKLYNSTNGQIDLDSKKTEIVSFRDGFHGRSLGALSATWQAKYQAPFAPLVPDFIPATLNDIDALQTVITEKTCGVIIEPIQVCDTSSLPIHLAYIDSSEWVSTIREKVESSKHPNHSFELFENVVMKLAPFSSSTRFRSVITSFFLLHHFRRSQFHDLLFSTFSVWTWPNRFFMGPWISTS